MSGDLRTHWICSENQPTTTTTTTTAVGTLSISSMSPLPLESEGLRYDDVDTFAEARWCQVAEAAVVSSTSGRSTCAAAIIALSPVKMRHWKQQTDLEARVCSDRCQSVSVSHSFFFTLFCASRLMQFTLPLWEDSRVEAARSHTCGPDIWFFPCVFPSLRVQKWTS